MPGCVPVIAKAGSVALFDTRTSCPTLVLSTPLPGRFDLLSLRGRQVPGIQPTIIPPDQSAGASSLSTRPSARSSQAPLWPQWKRCRAGAGCRALCDCRSLASTQWSDATSTSGWSGTTGRLRMTGCGKGADPRACRLRYKSLVQCSLCTLAYPYMVLSGCC